MMRKKSFGKLALVFALAALMLFGLCVCSKSSGTKAAATTQTEAAQTAAKTETKAETPVAAKPAETKVEAPKAETKVEAPVVETKAEEQTAVETKTEEPAAVEAKVEEPAVVETKVEETAPQEEDLKIADDGTISGKYEYADFASASFVMEGDKVTITYPSQYVYKEDIDSFMALCVEKFPEYLSNVYYEIPEDGTLVISYPESLIGSMAAKLGVLDYINEMLTSYIDSYVASVIADAEKEEAASVEVVEVEKDEPVYADTLTYKGLSTTVVIDNTYATLTVPEGIDADDINAVAAIVMEAYPEEASLITYSFENGVLTLTYPEQSDEFLLSVLDTLKEGGMYLIDLYGEVEEVVEEAAEVIDEAVEVATDVINGFDLVIEDDGTIRASFNYRDQIKAAVVVESDKATVTYPTQYISSSDIDTFMAYCVETFPELVENIYYDVPEEGTLVIYFPAEYVGGTYYRLSVLDELDKKITEYLDALMPAVEEIAEVAESHIYSDTLTYKGVTSTVTVDSTEATFTIPEGMSDEDIAAVAMYVNYLFPAEASVLTYSVDGNTVTVTYPEQTAEFLRGALDVLREGAIALIDQLPAKEETTVAEAPVEEAEKAVYHDVLTYKGVQSEVSVYSTYATFTVPEGMTAADIAAVADTIKASYPVESSLVTYSLSDGVLTLTYPEQDGSFLLAALDALRTEAVALIDSIDETKSVEEPKAEKAEAETAVAEVPAAVETPKKEEVKPVAPQAVVAPQAAEDESFLKGFSVSLAATPKYNIGEKKFAVGLGGRFEADFGLFSVGIKGQYDILSKYILAAGFGKVNFYSTDVLNAYALVGGGVTIGVGTNKGKVSALVEAGLGADYSITEKIALFGEVSAQWSIKNPGIGIGATLGAKVSF